MPKKLKGLNIIITRPLHQAKDLAQKIISQEGSAFVFPTIEIVSLKNDHAEINSNKFDYTIFTSKNAVLNAPSFVLASHETKNIAMGPSTALALKGSNCSVHAIPAAPFDSEHLLSLPDFEQIQNKNFLIVTGEGGRGLLERELAERGGRVTRLTVYKRAIPEVTREEVEQVVEIPHRIFVTTSSEGLSNLVAIMHKFGFGDELQGSYIIVISQRMLDLALKEGLQGQQLILSPNATDDAILESLIKWYSLTSQ